MRYALLITMIVCVACVAIDGVMGRLRRAAEGPPEVVLMQPPTTQAELDMRCAARARAEHGREMFATAAPAFASAAPAGDSF